MAISRLDTVSSNVTRVWRHPQGEKPIFLDRELNVVDNPALQGRFIDSIGYIQSQSWSPSDPKVKTLRVTLGLLYKEDPLASPIQQLYLMSIDPSKKHQYPKELQKHLSLLHTGKLFYCLCDQDYRFGLNRIRHQEIRDEFEMVPLSVEKGIYGTIYPELQTVEGIAFLTSLLSQKTVCIPQNHHQKLMEALSSPHSEIRQLAHQLLFSDELVANVKATTKYAKHFSASVEKAKPQLEDCALYFPSMKKYVEEIFRPKEITTRYPTDYDSAGFTPLEPILRTFQKEVEIADKVYAYLKQAFANLSKKRRDFYKLYGFSLYEDSYPPLPSFQDYHAISPPITPLETPYDLRAKQLEKFLEELEQKSKGEESKPLPSSSAKKKKKAKALVPLEKEDRKVVISPETTPDWKENIDLISYSVINCDYAYHAMRWFENPDEALSEEKYRNLPPLIQEKVTLFHTLPMEIDAFLGTNYCLQDTYKNPRTHQSDSLYSIPAEITFKGATYRGFIQYAIDSQTGVCYHRCFSDRSEHFTNQLMAHSIWNPVDYPTLEQALSISKTQKKNLQIEETPIVFDSTLKTIQIKTEEAVIVLFRIGD